MLRKTLLTTVLAITCGWAQTNIPDTAAGRTLRAWLDAFNSGEQAKLEAYFKAYEPGKSADQMTGFREQTGGFELLSIDKSEPTHIEFRVKEKSSPTNAIGK